MNSYCVWPVYTHSISWSVLSLVGAFPLDRIIVIHFSMKKSGWFFVCGRKKLTNKRDSNRDPNRSSACDFLETARLFAARCVCGRCRKEKIDKLQPTIPCAKINIRPPHSQLFILHMVPRCTVSGWHSSYTLVLTWGHSLGMRTFDRKKSKSGSRFTFRFFLPCVDTGKKKFGFWIAIHFSIFF